MLRKTLTLGAVAIALGVCPVSPKVPKPPDATVSPSPDRAQILKTTEAFVRNLFSWGPDFKLKVGPLSQSTTSNFYEVPLEVTFNDRTTPGKFCKQRRQNTFPWRDVRHGHRSLRRWSRQNAH